MGRCVSLGRLMLLQGMRPDEVTSLPKCDMNLERGQLQIRYGRFRLPSAALA